MHFACTSRNSRNYRRPRGLFDCARESAFRNRSPGCSGQEEHQESKNMASTHEPDQLLEPSNLLEPIDLTDKAPIDRIDESVSLDRPATPQSRFSRATSSAPPRRGGEPRSSLKPVLMVAGALACFGAGTAVPQLQTLLPSWASHWGVLDTASGPSASVDQPAKSD